MAQRLRWTFPALAVLFAALLVPAPAQAAANRVGETLVAIPRDRTTRFPGVAFDTANGVYLVVTGQFTIMGRFVSADGVPLGAPFVISPSQATLAPRVAYSPAAQTFVVTWIDEVARGQHTIGMRAIQYSNGSPVFLTGEVPVSRNGVDKFLDSAPSIACSSRVAECLVTWTEFRGNPAVRALRMTTMGVPVGAEMDIASSASWEGMPSIAYNTVQDEYFIVFTDEPADRVMGPYGVRIAAGSGAILSRTPLYYGIYNNYPEVAYNPNSNQYLVITWTVSGNGPDVYGTIINGDGNPTGLRPIAGNAFFEGGDGIGLAYNAVSGTYFAVFQGPSRDTLGVEIDGAGTPATVFRAMVSGASPNGDIFQPRVAAAANSGRWLISTSVDFNRVSTQLIGSDSTGPGPGPGPGPGGPTPEPIDLSVNNAPNGSWFLAEGTANSNFNSFYMVTNEHTEPVYVRSYFAGANGQAYRYDFIAPANGRVTLNLGQLIQQRKLPGTGDYAAVFQCLTPGTDIYVERSVYWGPNLEGSTGATAINTLSQRWMFAEGSRGGEIFANYFMLFNPTAAAISVKGEFYSPNGILYAADYIVGPQQRVTVDAGAIPALAGADFASTFTSQGFFMAERAMYWGENYSNRLPWIGGTATVGATGPSPQWFFAEGASAHNFETFYLLLNPNPYAIVVNAAFMVETAGTHYRSYLVGPNARRTVYLNQELPFAGSVASQFASTDGFLAERSIYWGPGRVEGTNVMGAIGAAREWHLPEGATGGMFKNYVMLQNPMPQFGVFVDISLFVEGHPRRITLPENERIFLPASSRLTIDGHDLLARAERADGLPPGTLAGRSYSVRARVFGGGVIVAEHVLYWNFIDGNTYWRSGAASLGIPVY